MQTCRRLQHEGSAAVAWVASAVFAHGTVAAPPDLSHSCLWTALLSLPQLGQASACSLYHARLFLVAD
jgi:hypothetical protein